MGAGGGGGNEGGGGGGGGDWGRFGWGGDFAFASAFSLVIKLSAERFNTLFITLGDLMCIPGVSA